MMTRRTVLANGLVVAAGGVAGDATAEDWPWDLPPLRTVEAGGHAIAWFEAGKGPPLVLVHGFSGSASLEWGRVFPALAKRYRVIAPYQLGFAPSAQPDIDYTSRTFVDSLGAFLRAVKAEGATLAGESFGGWVVGHYARAQAERRTGPDALPAIRKLVIVDGAVGVTPADRVSANGQSINDPAVGALTAAFLAAHPIADNARTKARAGPNITADMIQPAQLPKGLPTLVIWGDGDKLIPPAVGRRIVDGAPGARLVTIAACGHIPSVEQPAAFVKAISGFA